MCVNVTETLAALVRKVRGWCALLETPGAHGAQGAFSTKTFTSGSFPPRLVNLSQHERDVRILKQTLRLLMFLNVCCLNSASNVWLVCRWITPLLRRGLNKKLELADVYKAPSFDLADTLSERLERFVSWEVTGSLYLYPLFRAFMPFWSS